MQTHLDGADVDHTVNEVVADLYFWVLCENLPRNSHMFGGRHADDGLIVETLGSVCVKHEHA